MVRRSDRLARIQEKEHNQIPGTARGTTSSTVVRRFTSKHAHQAGRASAVRVHTAVLRNAGGKPLVRADRRTSSIRRAAGSIRLHPSWQPRALVLRVPLTQCRARSRVGVRDLDLGHAPRCVDPFSIDIQVYIVAWRDEALCRGSRRCSGGSGEARGTSNRHVGTCALLDPGRLVTARVVQSLARGEPSPASHWNSGTRCLNCRSSFSDGGPLPELRRPVVRVSFVDQIPPLLLIGCQIAGMVRLELCNSVIQ